MYSELPELTKIKSSTHQQPY